MAFRSYTLTLTGAAQRLSDVYGDGAGVANPANDIPYRALYLQGLAANTNLIYVGMDNTVTSSNHGFRITAADTDQPFPLIPPTPGGPLHLSDFWVLGTADEVLCVGGIPL